jgi:hypothetical protein
MSERGKNEMKGKQLIVLSAYALYALILSQFELGNSFMILGALFIEMIILLLFYFVGIIRFRGIKEFSHAFSVLFRGLMLMLFFFIPAQFISRRVDDYDVKHPGVEHVLEANWVPLLGMAIILMIAYWLEFKAFSKNKFIVLRFERQIIYQTIFIYLFGIAAMILIALSPASILSYVLLFLIAARMGIEMYIDRKVIQELKEEGEIES